MWDLYCIKKGQTLLDSQKTLSSYASSTELVKEGALYCCATWIFFFYSGAIKCRVIYRWHFEKASLVSADCPRHPPRVKVETGCGRHGRALGNKATSNLLLLPSLVLFYQLLLLLSILTSLFKTCHPFSLEHVDNVFNSESRQIIFSLSQSYLTYTNYGVGSRWNH
jgi:hypothetical protein